MNNYPPEPPPQNPSTYNPFNPYAGYDPNADYVPWLPGRQGPRFLPVVIIVAAILICSCCAFLVGVVTGIELPGIIAPPPPPPNQEQPPPEAPTPESFHWQISYHLQV